jgi:dethiobiotin synthetase
MNTLFITGTDTDVGKTVTTQLLLQALNKIDVRTLAIKPISAGCEITEDGLRNDDALILQAASGIQAPYNVINPIAFVPAIAPHIAAQHASVDITLSDLQTCLERAVKQEPRWLMVEGAGGWRLPLNNEGDFYSDFALQNQMKVVLVVGMKLGCLNHAVLTYQAILSDGLDCIGWVANQIDEDMPFYQENKVSLIKLLACPMLAEIPFQSPPINTIALSSAFSQVFR